MKGYERLVDIAVEDGRLHLQPLRDRKGIKITIGKTFSTQKFKEELYPILKEYRTLNGIVILQYGKEMPKELQKQLLLFAVEDERIFVSLFKERQGAKISISGDYTLEEFDQKIMPIVKQFPEINASILLREYSRTEKRKEELAQEIYSIYEKYGGKFVRDSEEMFKQFSKEYAEDIINGKITLEELKKRIRNSF